MIEKTYLKPISVEEITEEKRGSEFRGRNLPLYKLSSLDSSDKEVNVYVDPSLGKIVAIRTFEWRLWDLMWGLHIMDWRDRDDINNLFLKIFSILALISSITGIILFFRPKSKAWFKYLFLVLERHRFFVGYSFKKHICPTFNIRLKCLFNT